MQNDLKTSKWNISKLGEHKETVNMKGQFNFEQNRNSIFYLCVFNQIYITVHFCLQHHCHIYEIICDMTSQVQHNLSMMS